MLTQEMLKSVLDYSPSTGVFVWKVSKSGNKGVGSVIDNNIIQGE